MTDQAINIANLYRGGEFSLQSTDEAVDDLEATYQDMKDKGLIPKKPNG